MIKNQVFLISAIVSLTGITLAVFACQTHSVQHFTNDQSHSSGRSLTKQQIEEYIEQGRKQFPPSGVSSRPYSYPLRPGMPAWANLEGVDSQYDATQIPEDVVQRMPTKVLLQSILNHPLAINIIAFNSDQQGFEAMRRNVTALDALLKRPDLGQVLLEYHPVVATEQGSRSTEQFVADVDLQLMLLHMMMGQEEVISKLSVRQKQAYLALMISTTDYFAKYPEAFSQADVIPVFRIITNTFNSLNSADYKNLLRDNSEISAFAEGKENNLDPHTFVELYRFTQDHLRTIR